MASNVTFNGVVYAIPAEGDSGWGTVVQNYLIALASGTFQKSGGAFTLSAETNFGASFGLKSAYYKSQAANSSATGILRLGNTEGIGWRNAANNADLTLSVDSGDNLNFNGTSLSVGGTPVQTAISVADTSTISLALASNQITANIVAGSITDSMINAAAAIAYSKLNLASSIVNTDISASAAIAYSKLNLSAAIVNADISASAAIAYSKLAIADGDLTIAKTSGLQTALDAKQPTITATTSADYFRGDKTFQPLNKAAVGLSNVDNTSDATKNSAVAVLLNKDIDGGAASNSNRITLPKASKTTLDGLTRKAGTLVFSTDNGKPYYDDGSTLKLVGSGSGSGGTNYITNGDAEDSITGWNGYKDAASSRPVDGTGGTSDLTFSRSTLNPLAGTASFVISNLSGSNAQGSGYSFDFTINEEDKAKVVNIGISYKLLSGTFTVGTSTTDSDLIYYVYDVTNAKLIEPSNFKFTSNSTTIASKIQASFQTASNSTSYRLILHQATTSAALYELQLDSISVSPNVYIYGTPVTDWQSYAPTFTGFGTPTGVAFQYRRVGDTVQINGKFTSGTSTAVEARISLPSGLTSADVSKIPSIQKAGDGTFSASFAGTPIALIEPSVSYLTFGTQSASTAGLTKQVGSSFVSSGTTTVFDAFIPIQGWSSSVQMSDQTDTRVVSAKATLSATSGSFANATGGKVPINSAVSDRGGMVDTTNNRFNITVPGDYDLVAIINWSASTGLKLLSYRVNGGSDFYFSTIPSGDRINGTAFIPNLKSGDYVEVWARQDSGGTATIASGEANTSLSLKRLSGPSTIAASESCNLRVVKCTGASIASGGTGTLIFTDVTHSANISYNATTGVATFLTAGRYKIFAQCISSSAGPATLLIKKGSTQVQAGPYVSLNVVTMPFVQDTLQFLANDTIKIDIYNPSGSTFTPTSTNESNLFTIEKVGNY